METYSYHQVSFTADLDENNRVNNVRHNFYMAFLKIWNADYLISYDFSGLSPAIFINHRDL